MIWQRGKDKIMVNDRVIKRMGQYEAMANFNSFDLVIREVNCANAIPSPFPLRRPHGSCLLSRLTCANVFLPSTWSLHDGNLLSIYAAFLIFAAEPLE